MAGLYQLCSVALPTLLHAVPAREIRVSGFAFSVAEERGGMRAAFADAVWGEAARCGDDTRLPRFARFPHLVAHPPDRVHALHDALARIWRVQRAHYASPAGDDYGDWFIGELENVLDLFRHARANDHWVTNNPAQLERATSLAGLPRLRATLATANATTTPVRLGLAGAIALGAIAVATWRARRLAAKRAASAPLPRARLTPVCATCEAPITAATARD
jgi:hypothetical protein